MHLESTPRWLPKMSGYPLLADRSSACNAGDKRTMCAGLYLISPLLLAFSAQPRRFRKGVPCPLIPARRAAVQTRLRLAWQPSAHRRLSRPLSLRAPQAGNDPPRHRHPKNTHRQPLPIPVSKPHTDRYFVDRGWNTRLASNRLDSWPAIFSCTKG